MSDIMSDILDQEIEDLYPKPIIRISDIVRQNIILKDRLIEAMSVIRVINNAPFSGDWEPALDKLHNFLAFAILDGWADDVTKPNDLDDCSV